MKRALQLLAWLFLRQWQLHPVRQILTVGSVALGVALFLSTELSLSTIGGAVAQTQEVLSAGADLVITRGAAGVSEDELRRLDGRPEFAAVSGTVQVSALTNDQRTLILVCADPARAAKMMTQGAPTLSLGSTDFLRLLTDPAALLLTRDGLATLGLREGSRLPLTTAAGRVEFKVAGVLEVPPAAREALRNFGFLPLGAAQRLFGRERRVDRVDVRLRPDVSREEGLAAARACLAAGASLDAPAAHAEDQLAAIRGFRAMLVLESLLALLVAVFFLYNSVAAAVAERTRDAGLLRCLGLTRAGLRGLFFGEAAVAGILGLGLGAALGFLLARAALGFMVESVGILYFQVPPVEQLELSPTILAQAAVLALGVTSLAAWLASRPLTGQPALDFLRPIQSAHLQHRGIVRAALFGGVMMLVAVLLAWLVPAQDGWPVGRATALLLPSGAGLAAPALVLAVTGWLRRLLKDRARPPLLLALDAVHAHPARSAVTVTAFALSLGLVIGHGSMAGAMTTTLRTWLRDAIPGDVILGASLASPVPTFPFDCGVLEPLRTIPGVEDTVRIRLFRLPLPERTVMCMALDVAVAARRSRHDFLAGDPPDIYRRTIAGEAVIISDNLALRAGLKVGSPFLIPTPSGMHELPVAGVLRDYNSPLGTVFIDYRLYQRLFGDSLIDFGELCLTESARGELPRVLAQTREQLPEEYSFLYALPKERFIGGAIQVVEDLNQLSFVQIVLAAVIGAVGILVTVTLSVMARTQELLLLRAIGMDPLALRRTVLAEVAGLSLASAVAGLVIGNLVFLPANLVFRELAGFEFGYRVPSAHCALAVAIAGVTALLAAVVPLRTVQGLGLKASLPEE